MALSSTPRPAPQQEHSGAWYPLINQGVQWTPDGRPFYATSDGLRDFIPPVAAIQYQDDPKMVQWARSQGADIDYSDPNNPKFISSGAPGGSFFTKRGEWNSLNGVYDQGTDWGNVLSLVIAGAITAGVATAALGGTAAAQTAVDAALATGSAETGAAAGGVLASTAIPASGMTALSAVAPSGLVGSALSAAPVLASTAIPAANITSLPAVTASGEVGGAFGTGGELASTQIGNGMVGGLEAGSTGSGQVANALSTGSVLGAIGKKLPDILDAAGNLVSGATKNAGDTQLQNLLLDQQARNSNISANNSNISGESAVENALQGRSTLESKERNRALANIYMNSVTRNPSRSPFNPTAAPTNTQEYLDALAALSSQGAGQLKNPAAYGTGAMNPLKPYVPIDTNYKPNTDQSGLQKAGNVISPLLGIGSTLARIYAGR